MNTIAVYAPGHFDPADSYGLIACQLARHLTRLGAFVNAMSLGETVMDSQPDDVRAVTSRPLRPSFGGIVLGYPTGYHQHALLHYGPRVALTMFESTRLPGDWIEPLNAMDAVIVPSEFCADVFRNSGVTAPVHVVPLGIGDSYRYQERTEDRPLTFLTFLDRGERKGGIVALQAFLRAFGEDMRYKLVIKGRTPKKQAFTLTNPNIEVILEDYTEAELAALYARCDILINPHKGEGFGLIPREFAATGGLALTTAWSGTADDLPLWGYGLPYQLETAHWRGHKNLEGQELGEWAQLDPVRLAVELQTVAATWRYTRQLLPQKAQAARQLYRWDRFARRVLNIWEGVADAAAVGEPALHAEPV